MKVRISWRLGKYGSWILVCDCCNAQLEAVETMFTIKGYKHPKSSSCGYSEATVKFKRPEILLDLNVEALD